MRDWHFVFLIQCPLMLAFPVVNLLLPGFNDQSLEAGIIEVVRYHAKLMSDRLIFQGEWNDHIHCSCCGNGKVNATRKQHDSYCCSNLVSTDQYCEQGQVQWISAIPQILLKPLRTAFLSCNFGSHTTVSCYASVGTLHVQGTLRPKDINWMPVTVTTSYRRHRSTGTAISSETDSPAARSIAMNQRTSFKSEVTPNEDFEKSTRSRFSLSIAYLTLLALKYGDTYFTQILYTVGVAIVLAGYFLF